MGIYITKIFGFKAQKVKMKNKGVQVKPKAKRKQSTGTQTNAGKADPKAKPNPEKDEEYLSSQGSQSSQEADDVAGWLYKTMRIRLYNIS